LDIPEKLASIWRCLEGKGICLPHIVHVNCYTFVLQFQMDLANCQGLQIQQQTECVTPLDALSRHTGLRDR
jgi:hypothetical protein